MKRLVFLFLLLVSGLAHAQAGGEQLRVYLMTFGPGDAVWERFGHNAILIDETSQGYGVAYNWGMFDFDQPGFVPRLMKGRMLYWTEGHDAGATVEWYRNNNRSVWLQELNLTPRQREAMRDFVLWNAQEENKFYRYDYYQDNCSTRIRDAIDLITGGAVKRALQPMPGGSTYRSHTQALTYRDPFTYAGLMLAMGPRIDQPLSTWDEGFIPMQLREGIRQVTVRTATGEEQPLVLAERTLFEAERAPIAERAPDRIVLFTIVGFLIAGALVLLARIAPRRRAAGIAVAVAIGLWSLLIGFVGTMIALLWAFTDHVVTYSNENVLQANPFSLLLAVLGTAALLGRVGALRWSVWLALFIAGCSALGLLIQALPQFDQVNGDIIGLLLPVHGAVAWILWHRWRTHHIGQV